MKGTKSGFTLVELMVVVGIIILLMGVSIPAISVFMRSKSLENAGQTIQTVFMLARRATVTKKVKHRVIFFARKIDGSTVYGAKIYRQATLFDNTAGKPGESRGGYMDQEYLFPEGLTPQLFYTGQTGAQSIPNSAPPAINSIQLDKDGNSAIYSGKLEFQKNGSLQFGGSYKDVGSFDLERALDDGDKITPPAVPADILVTRKASIKSCYVDIDPGSGRTYVRVLIDK